MDTRLCRVYLSGLMNHSETFTVIKHYDVGDFWHSTPQVEQMKYFFELVFSPLDLFFFGNFQETNFWVFGMVNALSKNN